MKNFLKIFNYSAIVFAVSSLHLFAQNPVNSVPSSDKPTNQNNQANFQEMNQKRKENREKIQELKMENQKIREAQKDIQKERRVVNQNSQNQGNNEDRRKTEHREDKNDNRGYAEERREHREERREHRDERRVNREDRRDHNEERREYRGEVREGAKARENQQQNIGAEGGKAMPENQVRNHNESNSRDSRRGGQQFKNQGSPQQERAPR